MRLKDETDLMRLKMSLETLDANKYLCFPISFKILQMDWQEMFIPQMIQHKTFKVLNNCLCWTFTITIFIYYQHPTCGRRSYLISYSFTFQLSSVRRSPEENIWIDEAERQKVLTGPDSFTRSHRSSLSYTQEGLCISWDAVMFPGRSQNLTVLTNPSVPGATMEKSSSHHSKTLLLY